MFILVQGISVTGFNISDVQAIGGLPTDNFVKSSLVFNDAIRDAHLSALIFGVLRDQFNENGIVGLGIGFDGLKIKGKISILNLYNHYVNVNNTSSNWR